MLDITQLRKDVTTVATGLQKRGIAFDIERFEGLEAQRKKLQVETETLQARRNALAKEIGQLRRQGKDATQQMEESKAIPAQLAKLEQQLSELQQTLREWLSGLPNLPHSASRKGKTKKVMWKYDAGYRVKVMRKATQQH